MEPWQQRLMDERAQLSDRHLKLLRFIAGEEFEKLPIEDRELLYKQERAMARLLDILDERIKRFENAVINNQQLGDS